MSKLADKVAVVTGASKGIGAAIAKALAAEGAAVVMNYVASRHDADTVVAEITSRVARQSRSRVMYRSRGMSNVCLPIRSTHLDGSIFW